MSVLQNDNKRSIIGAMSQQERQGADLSNAYYTHMFLRAIAHIDDLSDNYASQIQIEPHRQAARRAAQELRSMPNGEKARRVLRDQFVAEITREGATSPDVARNARALSLLGYHPATEVPKWRQYGIPAPRSVHRAQNPRFTPKPKLAGPGS